ATTTLPRPRRLRSRSTSGGSAPFPRIYGRSPCGSWKATRMWRSLRNWAARYGRSSARSRFERTYEHVNGLDRDAPHAPEDMISIPDHRQLIAELSSQRYERTETGKIKMVGKEAMKREGVKSPDHADALCLSFYQPPELGVPKGSARRRG